MSGVKLLVNNERVGGKKLKDWGRQVGRKRKLTGVSMTGGTACTVNEEDNTHTHTHARGHYNTAFDCKCLLCF